MPAGTEFYRQVEKQTFALVNGYRKENDLPPLVWSATIADVARAHSRDMATREVDFGHAGFSDRVTRLRTVRPGFQGAGENVLMTDDLNDLAQKAVTLWLHSPHHLKNIRGDYNYSGMGVWQDKSGAVYFTQIFLSFRAVIQETAAPTQPIMPWGLFASPQTRGP